MLRLRDTSGKTWDLPKSVVFVEICDESGRLAAVIHRVRDNKASVYTPGDESFERYKTAYHVESANIDKI